MQFRTITRIVGIMIILFSGIMLFPGIVAFIYRDGAGKAFLQTIIVSLVIGLMLWIPNRRHLNELKAREGFLIVTLIWVVLGSEGALPFIFMGDDDISLTDAFFESFSALTTTGATTISGLDTMPKAILFYRHLLQWVGGMGIIVLAVAILPLLGVGGMQLYRAEIPGPIKDDKMRPRIAETAKTLWYIYVILTVTCLAALWLSGMSFFDALCHSFSTVAIGGFSTHDRNIGFFNSQQINMVITIFTLLAGCNYALHFASLTNRSLKVYWRDPEFKAYIFIQIVLIVICFWVLSATRFYKTESETLNQSIFHVVSMLTTAGFLTEGATNWPLFLTMLLVIASFIGGCAGSSGGGLKVVRIVVLYLQGVRELKRLVHPHAVYTIKLGSRALPERVIEAVWGFFSAYAVIFIISILGLTATGIDILSAFSAVAASLNNLGVGLGIVAAHFDGINDVAKWILIITMLFGRLEVFTLLVLFTPIFWRK